MAVFPMFSRPNYEEIGGIKYYSAYNPDLPNLGNENLALPE